MDIETIEARQVLNAGIDDEIRESPFERVSNMRIKLISEDGKIDYLEAENNPVLLKLWVLIGDTDRKIKEVGGKVPVNVGKGLPELLDYFNKEIQDCINRDDVNEIMRMRSLLFKEKFILLLSSSGVSNWNDVGERVEAQLMVGDGIFESIEYHSHSFNERYGAK